MKHANLPNFGGPGQRHLSPSELPQQGRHGTLKEFLAVREKVRQMAQDVIAGRKSFLPGPKRAK